MKWLIAALVGAVTLFVVLDTGAAIKCYDCNSYFSSDCGDWFNNKTFEVKECAEGVTMCRKIVTETFYEKEWNVRYKRECAETGEVGDDEGRECKDRTGTKKVKVKYCHCNNRDGCNGAAAVKLPLMLLTLPVLGMVFRKL